MEMTSKQRMLTAINGGTPDRLPVTTHHIMPYFLKKYMNGISNDEFFDYFRLDPILWTVPHKPDESKGEYGDPTQDEIGLLESWRIFNDNWRIESQEVPDPQYKTTRYDIVTPKGTLTTVLQSNDITVWVSEQPATKISPLAAIVTHGRQPLFIF